MIGALGGGSQLPRSREIYERADGQPDEYGDRSRPLNLGEPATFRTLVDNRANHGGSRRMISATCPRSSIRRRPPSGSLRVVAVDLEWHGILLDSRTCSWSLGRRTSTDCPYLVKTFTTRLTRCFKPARIVSQAFMQPGPHTTSTARGATPLRIRAGAATPDRRQGSRRHR
jgi:hypothetical protein